MTAYDLHESSYSGTTEAEWNAPQMEAIDDIDPATRQETKNLLEDLSREAFDADIGH